MPGKIRAAKERFTAAHEAAVDRIVAELEKATAETFNLQDEGVAAAKLLPAMVEQSRAEIREITSEFATQTNGPPPGPLPDAAPKSQPPSQASGEQQAQPQPQLGEPQASWQKANGQG